MKEKNKIRLFFMFALLFFAITSEYLNAVIVLTSSFFWALLGVYGVLFIITILIERNRKKNMPSIEVEVAKCGSLEEVLEELEKIKKDREVKK